jgi:hypothetical protein
MGSMNTRENGKGTSMKARHMLAYLATGAALLTSATAAWAQTPDLKPNSTMALREFEPAPDEPYQIGRGPSSMQSAP